MSELYNKGYFTFLIVVFLSEKVVVSSHYMAEQF